MKSIKLFKVLGHTAKKKGGFDLVTIIESNKKINPISGDLM